MPSNRPPRVPWYTVNPADLRNEIQLASRSAAVDGFGQPLTAWNVYYTTYASIRLLSGREAYQGAEFTSASQYRIRFRWPGDLVGVIGTGDRVLFGGRVFVIQIVDNVEMRSIVVELTCLEIDGTS